MANYPCFGKKESMKIHIQENVPLAPLTTFKIGGKARYFTEAHDASGVTTAFEWAESKKVPVFLLAGGSNVLFSDQGYQGLVIVVTGEQIQIHENIITASAGSVLQNVIDQALEQGLGGMEYMSGIPGSFGGAIRGNAGAFGTEIGDVLVSVKAVNSADGMVKEFSSEECQFSYRHSYFKTHPEWTILEGTCRLVSGKEPRELKKIREETRAKREAKHPQDAKCAGSFFMNPVVKNEKLLQEFEEDTGMPSRNGKLPAGWLITKVGLRGKKIGGACISVQHPNYLVNTGNATADDVAMLASLVKTRVRNQLGIQLKEEIQFVGF